MKIKAIFFDLGDIFFEAHYWRKWMWSYLKQEKLYRGSFAEFYNLYESYITTIYKGSGSYNEMYRNFVLDMGIPQPEYFTTLSFSVKRFFEDNRTLYVGVKETLEVLNKNRVKVVVITDNEQSEEQVRKKVIDRYGINDLIGKVITSFEAKATKPSFIIFEQALAIVECSKDEVLFVAHDLDEINGAVEVGLKTVEFNNYLNINTNADIRVRDFSQLLDLL